MSDAYGIDLSTGGRIRPSINPPALESGGASKTAEQRLAFSSMFLVLLALTKFHRRGTDFALQTTVNAQILYELACFGLLGLIAMFLYRRVRMTQTQPRISWLGVSLIAYTVLAFASILWSANPLMSAVRAIQLGVIVLLPLLFSYLMSATHFLKSIGRAIVAYCVVSSIIALSFPWANGTEILYSGAVRFTWFDVHPGTAGGALAFALIFCVYELISIEQPANRKALVLFLILLLGFISTILVMTYARGALLSGLFGALVLVFFQIPSGAVRIYTGMLSVFVLLLAVSVLMPALSQFGMYEDQPIVGFLMRGNDPDQFMGLNGRTELWATVQEVIAANPIVGVGYGASRYSLIQYFSWAAEAHNAYLEAPLQLGILGASLLFMPLLVTAAGIVAYLLLGSRVSAGFREMSLMCALLAFLALYGVVSEGVSTVGYTPDAFIAYSIVFFLPSAIKGPLVRTVRK